jgi:putative transposase
VVATMDELDAYPWSGHKALIGRASSSFQDCNAVLLWLGKRRNKAIAAYGDFLERGASQGHRPELTGRIRDVLERRDDRVVTDERVLGAVSSSRVSSI